MHKHTPTEKYMAATTGLNHRTPRNSSLSLLILSDSVSLPPSSLHPPSCALSLSSTSTPLTAAVVSLLQSNTLRCTSIPLFLPLGNSRQPELPDHAAGLPVPQVSSLSHPARSFVLLSRPNSHFSPCAVRCPLSGDICEPPACLTADPLQLPTYLTPV